MMQWEDSKTSIPHTYPMKIHPSPRPHFTHKDRQKLARTTDVDEAWSFPTIPWYWVIRTGPLRE